MTAAATFPGPDGLVANLRMARAIVSEPCGALDQLAAAHGRSSQITVGPIRLVFLGRPEHITELLATDSSAFRWGRVARSLTVVIGPTSMIVSDGEDHKRRRALVQPAFAKRRLDSWAERIVAETDRMIEETIPSAAPRTVDLHDMHRRLVRRISVRVLFGDMLAMHADAIGEAIEPAMRYAGQPALRQLPHPFPFTFRARARSARAEVDKMLDEIIRNRQSRSDPSAEAGSDALLDVLLDARQDGVRLDDAEVRDQIVTLIGAGYDTTSAVLSWTIARSLLHPDAWSRLRAEANAHLASAAETAALSRVPFASAVVDETLRIHPAGPISPREVVRDITIGGLPIRAGSVVAFSPHLAGRDPGTWDSPLEFRPERFLGDAPAIVEQRAQAWLPFGRGSRSCIGFALAQMQLVLITARLAQRLDVALTSPSLPNPSGLIVTRPEGGLPAVVRRFD